MTYFYSLWLFLTLLVLSQVLSGDPVHQTIPPYIKFASDWSIKHIPAANSEQREPIYVGLTPFHLANLKHNNINNNKSPPLLPDSLRRLALKQMSEIRKQLYSQSMSLINNKLKTKSTMIIDPIEIEMWPSYTDDGLITWSMARWRIDKEMQEWIWLSKDDFDFSNMTEFRIPDIPETLWCNDTKESKRIFEDFLLLDDLYEKPRFGDCIWELGHSVVNGWVDVIERDSWRKKYEGKNVICRAISQPAKFNGKPIVFVGSLDAESIIRFQPKVTWVIEPSYNMTPIFDDIRVSEWPVGMKDTYRDHVEILSGEAEISLNGKTVRFTRKNSADVANQLMDVISYLEVYYERLGIATHRQSFSWRGIPQANLIAVIPGSLASDLNHPVILSDHIDTAFAEDYYKEFGKRKSAPGADDNMSSAATLMEAGRILQGGKPKHDIWLVHLTGEEFPGDDLGARHFVQMLLSRRKILSGIIQLDMIGHLPNGSRIFQINAGNSSDSKWLARVALGAALDVQKDYVPVIRDRWDKKSYLYNTDGIIFSQAGFPVILINEHINGYEYIDRRQYHEMTDTIANMDFNYAIALAKTAIETVARVAEANTKK